MFQSTIEICVHEEKCKSSLLMLELSMQGVDFVLHRLSILFQSIDILNRYELAKPINKEEPFERTSHFDVLRVLSTGRTSRNSSKRPLISPRRFRSASLWLTRNSGERLYGAELAILCMSASRIDCS